MGRPGTGIRGQEEVTFDIEAVRARFPALSISDGDLSDDGTISITVAGGGGGGIRQGQHVVYKQDESALDNLWLSMLKHVGCPEETFAGSNGVLNEIFA